MSNARDDVDRLTDLLRTTQLLQENDTIAENYGDCLQTLHTVESRLGDTGAAYDSFLNHTEELWAKEMALWNQFWDPEFLIPLPYYNRDGEDRVRERLEDQAEAQDSANEHFFSLANAMQSADAAILSIDDACDALDTVNITSKFDQILKASNLHSEVKHFSPSSPVDVVVRLLRKFLRPRSPDRTGVEL